MTARQRFFASHHPDQALADIVARHKPDQSSQRVCRHLVPDAFSADIVYAARDSSAFEGGRSNLP